MDTVKTATGKVFTCESLSLLADIGILYIRISGASLTEVAKVFGDPEETRQLWYNSEYISGYTRLSAIIPESGGYRINLERG